MIFLSGPPHESPRHRLASFRDGERLPLRRLWHARPLPNRERFVSCRLAKSTLVPDERQRVAEEVDFILRFDPTIGFDRQSSSILLITSAEKFGGKLLAVLMDILAKIIPTRTECICNFAEKLNATFPSADEYGIDIFPRQHIGPGACFQLTNVGLREIESC